MLVEEIRSTVSRLSLMMGFTLKVIENAGSSKGSVLGNKNP